MDRKRFKELEKEVTKIDSMVSDAVSMTRYEFIEKYSDDKYRTLQLLIYWNMCNDCYDIKSKVKDIEEENIMKESYGGTDPDD
jgi:hypothetical protein|tara:strand:- start:217 stop:465 length:249 start_codon:yes stop_codon:yes gene_type:complete